MTGWSPGDARRHITWFLEFGDRYEQGLIERVLEAIPLQPRRQVRAGAGPPSRGEAERIKKLNQ